MAKRLQFRRLLMLAILLGLGFAGLGYRLVDLQVFRHAELSALANKMTQREYVIEPRRGDIVDAKGNLLASSVFVYKVCADPTLITTNISEVARTIAPLLQLPESEIARDLSRTRVNDNGETVPVSYVVLKSKVPADVVQAIRVAMGHLKFGDGKPLSKKEQTYYSYLRNKSIFADRTVDQLRVYPNQRLASQVLGYVGLEDRVEGTNHITQTTGKDGIELSFNSKLCGTRGWRVTKADRRGREIASSREQDVEARDGMNVVLTIDSVIQQILESTLSEGMEKHTPASITGIVIRPATGEILAMASLPDYDPNNLIRSSADERRNRVVMDINEPGSTFKVVVVSGALNEGVVKLTDVFDCENGSFYYGGRTLHDHAHYGQLSVQSIITKSSNIGAAKIGIKMGEKELQDYIERFGFGTPTGVPLLGEGKGIAKPVDRWTKVSIAQIPMGQGIAVTRMQMIMAMCAIANQGVLMRPLLVDRLEDSDHHVVAKFGPQRVRQVISEATAKQMVTALKTVVSADGTAAKAALEHYAVAGKTGTAQKVVNGNYSADKFVSSFIGFFPADKPELCISIVLDEPKQGHYGGEVAGPIFKQVAERVAGYLNIKTDDGEPPSAHPEGVAVSERVVRD
jgi:cell division protein FtsI/penicillin-binding protein 2